MENNYEDIQSCRMFDITLDELKRGNSKKVCYACGYDIEELLKQLAEKDKDKISFAVEQLEEVKEFCFEKRTVDDFGVLTITVDEDLGTSDNLLHFIDNQIKQLKEGK